MRGRDGVYVFIPAGMIPGILPLSHLFRTPNYKKWPLVVVVVLIIFNFFCAPLQQPNHDNPPPTIRFPSSTLIEYLRSHLYHYPTSHMYAPPPRRAFVFVVGYKNKVSAHDMSLPLFFIVITSTLTWLPFSLLPI